jgi:hypothetical protein
LFHFFKKFKIYGLIIKKIEDMCINMAKDEKNMGLNIIKYSILVFFRENKKSPTGRRGIIVCFLHKTY